MDYRNYMPYGYGEMPFYSGFKFPLDANEEQQMEKDKEYLKSLYPAQAKNIQALVEDECDRLEYEGSIMFDEYPDKLGLRKISMDIYNKMNKEESLEKVDNESSENEDIYMMNYGYHYRPPMPPLPPAGPCKGPGPCLHSPAKDIIDILLYDEIYRRRCRHNRCRRRLYW